MRLFVFWGIYSRVIGVYFLIMGFHPRIWALSRFYGLSSLDMVQPQKKNAPPNVLSPT